MIVTNSLDGLSAWTAIIVELPSSQLWRIRLSNFRSMTELACGMQDSLVCFRRLKKKNVLAIYCNRNYVALVAFYYNGLHA